MNTGSQRLYTVEELDQPVRLDAWLAEREPALSRSAVKRLTADGAVTVDGAVAKASRLLRGAERVELILPPVEEVAVAAEDIPLDVLYEDRDIIAVNKPAGMVVHPAPGHSSGTLVNALLFHCDDLSGINGELRPGIVHRLDSGTTGVIIAAKNDAAHTGLARQFQDRKVEKHYVAVVFGRTAQESGRIEAPIARDPGNRLRMAVIDGGREAVTIWKRNRVWNDFSLLELQILTGRTHQIRVHLSHTGYPIVGDELYAGKRWRGVRDARQKSLARSFPRPALHAHVLMLEHPVSGERLRICAPLPGDLVRVVELLDEEP